MDALVIKRNQLRRQYFGFLIQIAVTVASAFVFWLVIVPSANIVQMLISICLWLALLGIISFFASYPYEGQRNERAVKQHYKKSLI